MSDPDIKDKTIEYFVGKATDPYVGEEERKRLSEKLCEKVNYEIEGAQLAVSLLAHKIASPNQDESLYSLQAVDLLVRRCGAKVHTRVGKFRFLNQLVRLLTPKYLGKETSDKVKKQAIVMLFTWQKSMGHIEKFKEVYESLREHGHIEEDPVVDEDAILNVPPPPPKLAVFEDEEKSRLLKELLQSTNPEDLQTANRLIKSLVRSEDQKLEKINKRADDLETTVKLCRKMEVAVRMATPDIRELHDRLSEMRPLLFRHANEAAESGDEILAEILRINDTVNKLMQQYDLRKKEVSTVIPLLSKEIDLLGDEGTSQQVEGSLLIDAPAIVDAAHHLIGSIDDVPFIGFESKTNTPQIPRKQPAASQSNGHRTRSPLNLSDLSTLDDIFSKATPSNSFSFHAPKPTLLELSQASANAPLNLSPLDPISDASSDFEANLLSSPVRCLPESVSFSVHQVQLSAEQPQSILDQKNLKIILHYSQNSPPGTTGVRTALITICNFNTFQLQNVFLSVSTNNMRMSSRLLWKENTSLEAFMPGHSVPHANAILLALPLDIQLSKCDFDFSIRYSHVFQETLTGMFTLRIS